MMLAAVVVFMTLGSPDTVQSRYERASRVSAYRSQSRELTTEVAYEPLIDFFATEVEWDLVLNSLQNSDEDPRKLLKKLVRKVVPKAVAGQMNFLMPTKILNTEATIHVNMRMVDADGTGLRRGYCRVLFSRDANDSWKGEILQSVRFPSFGGDTWLMGIGAEHEGRLYFAGARYDGSNSADGGVEIWSRDDGRWNCDQSITIPHEARLNKPFRMNADGRYSIDRLEMHTVAYPKAIQSFHVGPHLTREDIFEIQNERYVSLGERLLETSLLALDEMILARRDGRSQVVRSRCADESVYQAFMSLNITEEYVRLTPGEDFVEQGTLQQDSDVYLLFEPNALLTFTAIDGKYRLAIVEVRRS